MSSFQTPRGSDISKVQFTPDDTAVAQTKKSTDRSAEANKAENKEDEVVGEKMEDTESGGKNKQKGAKKPWYKFW